jgi:hypothetical protein
VQALITTLQSTFFGILGFQIRTGLTHTIPYILMTWESGESTFGYFFWQFSQPQVQFSGTKDSCYFFRMAKFPRWSDMKHFNAVSTTEFSDGQAFYDILKVSDQVSAEILSDLQISAFYPVLSTSFQTTRHFYTVSVPIYTTDFLSASTV